jgi:hypothetical protein
MFNYLHSLTAVPSEPFPRQGPQLLLQSGHLLLQRVPLELHPPQTRQNLLEVGLLHRQLAQPLLLLHPPFVKLQFFLSPLYLAHQLLLQHVLLEVLLRPEQQSLLLLQQLLAPSLPLHSFCHAPHPILVYPGQFP